ncbi:MAG: guanylate kinase [Syntrophomonadaceae bacterium]|nr:guanylate kinase [Syntrophomonadaceae bacterium]
MSRRGILFVLSGPSGVGKGTIRENLLADRNDIQVSISATTRTPRIDELDGVDYFFMDKASFLLKQSRGEFLESATVYSNMYGTPRDFVESNLLKGRDVLLEIDIQGAMQVKEKMPEGVFIFISPPTVDDLLSRLCKRGKDSVESIEERMASCRQEMSYMSDYDYVVINDDLDEAVKKVEAIIIAERCKTRNINLE